jgi:S-methylmethionine-dependent homocysteine/selenocysteine methylase
MPIGPVPSAPAMLNFGRRNEDSLRFIADLRERFGANAKPIVLNAVVGPRGDAYRPEAEITMEAAEDYFTEQLGWLAATEADMVTALTFNQAGEAAGLAELRGPPVCPRSFRSLVETSGALPTGQSLSDAIRQVDEVADGYPSYFMINCAHPEHFAGVLQNAPWTQRIRGVRANASHRSHEELDAAPDLDARETHTNSRASTASWPIACLG